jgi:hypothetical protein
MQFHGLKFLQSKNFRNSLQPPSMAAIRAVSQATAGEGNGTSGVPA